LPTLGLVGRAAKREGLLNMVVVDDGKADEIPVVASGDVDT
jgi:hypothetical protein